MVRFLLNKRTKSGAKIFMLYCVITFLDVGLIFSRTVYVCLNVD